LHERASSESPPHPLEGCWAKLAWARVNSESLEREVTAYFGDPADPNSPRAQLDLHATSGFFQSRTDLPWQWPLMVGDIVHAFRTTLDYLTWELAKVNLRRIGKTREPSRRTQFPILRNAADWPKESAARLVDLGEDDRTRIEEFQPYHAERLDPPLLTLNTLANRDKHQTLNLVLARAGFMDERLADGLQGWAHVASSQSRRMTVRPGQGDQEREFEMKPVFQISLEGGSRIDWVLDGIGAEVTAVVRTFQPVFEEA
jgi:hypothetical protein